MSLGEFVSSIKVGENVEPRLISSLSRTGRVYWQDDFEAYTSAVTEKWRQRVGTISLDTSRPFRGKACMKITTGAVLGNDVEADKYLGALPLGRLGWELWFLSQFGVANIHDIELGFYLYDGAYCHEAWVAWLGTVGTLQEKWQYINSEGDYTDIPNGTQKLYVESDLPIWHHFKLVVDFRTGKYVKLVCDDKTFDLSALSYHKTPDTTKPCIDVGAYIENATATAVSLYVDDVILTDQEP
jgi:hypothetical protein